MTRSMSLVVGAMGALVIGFGFTTIAVGVAALFTPDLLIGMFVIALGTVAFVLGVCVVVIAVQDQVA